MNPTPDPIDSPNQLPDLGSLRAQLGKTIIKVGDRYAVEPVFYTNKLIIVFNDEDTGPYIGWRSHRTIKDSGALELKPSGALANIRKELRLYDTDALILSNRQGFTIKTFIENQDILPKYLPVSAKEAGDYSWEERILWPERAVRSTAICFTITASSILGIPLSQRIWLE